MGLFGKIKNILFEEEEIEAPAKDVKRKDTSNIEIEKEEIKEEKIEKAKKIMDDDTSELFEKEPSFNFPDFDEDEFENTLPRFKKEVKKDDLENSNIFGDFSEDVRKSAPVERKREEIYKKPEPKTYKPISLFSGSKKVNEEPVKKFTPSPIISPVYGILDKDYHPSEIRSKDDDLSIKRSSKLDVDSVRKKAFEPEPVKEVKKEEVEVEEVVEEKPKKEERISKKSLDELLADSATETVAIDEDLTVENNIKEIEDELDKMDEDLVLDEKVKEPDEDDTLEQDLFELIDSMYEDKKEDE